MYIVFNNLFSLSFIKVSVHRVLRTESEVRLFCRTTVFRAQFLGLVSKIEQATLNFKSKINEFELGELGQILKQNKNKISLTL